MNTLVNFEIAKLLKDKEFMDKNMLGEVRLSQPKFYDSHGVIHNIKDAFEKTELNLRECYNAPTISEVIIWMYEKHGIWTEVVKPVRQKLFRFNVDNKDDINEFTSVVCFKSPTEAYEAAIEYVLNNLV